MLYEITVGIPSVRNSPGLPDLRDLHLPQQLRLVDSFLQFPVQPIQLLIQLRGESFQTLPIHPSTAGWP